MGIPGASDSHARHGELPNLAYRDARLLLGEENGRPYIGLTGNAEIKQAFSLHYRAKPLVRLFAGETTAQVSLQIENLRPQELPYMYLCHINYLPVDGARLYYSAPGDKEHIKTHLTIPNDLAPEKAQKLKDYILALQEDPTLHDLIDSTSQYYEPEIVFTLDYKTDEAGMAHTMLELPSRDAFYVAHRKAELPLVLRWIARTGAEDALGMALPSTAEHFGLKQAQTDGQVKTLAGHDSIIFQMEVGYLAKAKAQATKEKLKDILR